VQQPYYPIILQAHRESDDKATFGQAADFLIYFCRKLRMLFWIRK
jgi:hypothetical protein